MLCTSEAILVTVVQNKFILVLSSQHVFTNPVCSPNFICLLFEFFLQKEFLIETQNHMKYAANADYFTKKPSGDPSKNNKRNFVEKMVKTISEPIIDLLLCFFLNKELWVV